MAHRGCLRSPLHVHTPSEEPRVVSLKLSRTLLIQTAFNEPRARVPLFRLIDKVHPERYSLVGTRADLALLGCRGVRDRWSPVSIFRSTNMIRAEVLGLAEDRPIVRGANLKVVNDVSGLTQIVT